MEICTQTKHLKLISVIYHESWPKGYLVYKTRGPKATLLQIFRSLARDADSLPASCDKEDILRILEKNKNLVRNNGRRIFALITVNREPVVLDAHIGYITEDSHRQTVTSSIMYQEYDLFSFDMLWFLEAGHYIIVPA